MPWYEYTPTPGGDPKPLVAVYLWHGSQWTQLVALVDSGADCSLLDIAYAELVGLDRTDAVPQLSIAADGNSFTTYEWPNAGLELQFRRHRFPFRGTFADFGNSGDGENLMGRSDFFSSFVIQFWDSAELMNIDLSPDFPEGNAINQVAPPGA